MTLATFLIALGLAQTAALGDALDKTIPELQEAMAAGELSSADLVRQYLARIEAFDRRGPVLRSMVYINPRAIEHAEALDLERQAGKVRSPLHGIPIVLKDNYDTYDMPTSAGSIALAGYVPGDDGYQVARLREAGAVFIGKANMHELADGITTISSIGGQTRNPYDPERVPGGSSGGTGAAIGAGLATVGMGSDTCGSIRIPAANNNLFGLRVTQGLSSRDGIVPLSHTQDVGGPLATSVIDLVLVLDETVGPDPADPQTSQSVGHVPESYRSSLDENALQGLRLGMFGPYLEEDGAFEAMTKVVRDAAAAMAEHGAVLVDVDLPDVEALLKDSGVIGKEFRPDLHDYLAAAENPPVHTIAEILEKGLFHTAMKERLEGHRDREEDPEAYRAQLDKRLVVKQALLDLLDREDLDALIYPTLRMKPARIGDPQRGSSCSLSANSGLPAITMPAGFTTDGLPVGIELLARPFEEANLLSVAYAYEHKTRPRRAPSRTPSLLSGELSVDFEASGTPLRAKLRLDHPTQVLFYELDFRGRRDNEIVDVKLHHGENGAIIAMLGSASKGSTPIRNEDLPALLDGSLWLGVYSTSAPTGEARVRIRRRR